MRLTLRGKIALALSVGAGVCITLLPPDGLDDHGPTNGAKITPVIRSVEAVAPKPKRTEVRPSISFQDCTYYSDGSGRCGQQVIPPLKEYDADFCGDVDPQGRVITLCRAPDGYDVTVYEDGSGVQTIDGKVVKKFTEGTFVWDCHRMGNHRCG